MATIVAEKRPLGALGRIGMVVGLHAAARYLIATSLGIVPPLIAKDPPVVTLAPDDPTPPEPVPDVPRPEHYEPQVYMPTPEVPVIVPMDETGLVITERNDDPPV